jgi:RimJ/RimL family protein N-acetyltransferase
MAGVDDPAPTARLTFRRLTADDVGLLLDLDSDPAVMRYLTGGTPTSLAREHEIVARILDEYARQVPGRWLAHDRASGRFVGWFGLDSDTSPPDERELGYRLCAGAWGRGLATEGARAMIAFGFENLGLRRIWAETMAVNARSRRVLEKAGLRYVRTFHPHFDDPVPGSDQGEVEYEIRATADG